MALAGQIINLFAAGTGTVVRLNGKPQSNGNRGVQGSYEVGNPAIRSIGVPVPVNLYDVVGNLRFLTDLQKAMNAGQIYVLDVTGNQLQFNQIVNMLDGLREPSFAVGPFFSPGTVTLNQYIVGSASDGVIARQGMTIKYCEITMGVANTVGSNVLTVTNITTGLTCTFTFVAGTALFARATANALLYVSKGDKLSLQWTAVGGTPGSNVQVVLQTAGGE